MSLDVSKNNDADVMSVSDLNRGIKQCLESEYPMVWVRGEISNFTAHASGHWYFSLKDEKSQIMAVMFRGHNARLKFRPKVGDEVVVRARISVYEPRGNYQIVCELMDPVGAGVLQKEFEALKAKLAAEGLFDKKSKQSLPSFPQKLAVVTSPTGAAIKDILNVLNRRYKALEVTIFPCRVQGDMAAKEIREQVKRVNELGYFDVMIVGRGGGSMEDLWCFNDEALAREIAASSIPVISAVGHEIDFTISDFVADLRAPTPSAAAELVVANTTEIIEKLKSFKLRLWKAIGAKLESYQLKIVNLERLLGDPTKTLASYQQKIEDLKWKLEKLIQTNLREKQHRISKLRSNLLSPAEELKRISERNSYLQKNLQLNMQRFLKDQKAKLKPAEKLAPLTQSLVEQR
jgi:exodeoxyribonuclease VII large subunit